MNDLMKKACLLIICTALVAGCAGIKTDKDNHYKIEDNKVYWLDWSRLGKRFKSEQVFSADSNSFKTIKGGKWSADKYATDNKNVYLTGVPIPYAEPNSYKMVAKNYSIDERSVFYKSKRLPGFEPINLQILRDSQFVNSYAVSGSKGAYDSYVFDVCDASSFNVKNEFSGVWSSDGHCVFYKGRKVEDAHISSFVTINYHFAKDSNRVFFHNSTLVGANPKTFSLLSNKSRSVAVATDGEQCWGRKGQTIDCDTGKNSVNPIQGMSQAEMSAMALKMALQWSEDKAYSKEQILKAEEYTIKTLLKKFKEKVLTKGQVGHIDLGELPIGFSYTMNSSVKNPVGENTKLTYILTNKIDGKLFFDVFHNKMLGVLKEVRGVNGSVFQKALPSDYLPTTHKYLDQACLFLTTEICVEDIQVIRGGNSTDHVLLKTTKIEYENGVWTKWQSNKAGSMEIKERAIYDKFGLPLYIISYNSGSLKDEFKRQD